MPSVASDSPAVPPSRTPLPSLRNAADSSRGDHATPFADLLDSAAPAPEPPPPPARADRPDRAPDAPPSHNDNKPAGPDASQDANAPAANDTKDTKAADDTDPNTPKAAKTAKDAKTGKAGGIVKLTLAKDVAPSADKSKPEADPTAALATAVVTPVPVPPPQAALLATGQISAAPADAQSADADALAALAAAGQGQHAADVAKPAGMPAGKQAEKQGSAEAKAAATDAQTAAAEVDPAKDGQARGNGDKPAAPLHPGAADLLAKADGALAPSNGDAGAAAKAGTDAVQSIGGAAPPNATTAANPAATVATSAAAPAQAAAVPLSGLAVEITAQAHAGNNHFEIRLDPPELGRIDVKLNVDRDGNVSTQIVADRSDTLDLLKRDASTLERALQQAGLKTAYHGLDFSLRQHAFSQDDTASQSNASRLVVSDDDPAPLEALRQGYGRLLGLGGGLDIRV